MNALEKMAKSTDNNEDVRKAENIAGMLYDEASELMDQLSEKNQGVAQQTQVLPQETLASVMKGMSENYRETSGELQSGLVQTQYVPEYDPYLKRDQINNIKDNLKKDIDIKDKIDYTEHETMYPKKDKDPRIVQQQTDFYEPDIEDSER